MAVHAAPPSREPTEHDGAALAGVITLALRVLGERTLLTFHHVFPLLALGTGLALWWKVLDSPTDRQLIGLSLYGLFSFALTWARKK